MILVRRALLPAFAAFMFGCGSDDSLEASDNNTSTGKGDEIGSTTVCAAVRGNGQLIPAHFGALARVVEHYGPLHAIAGGSSGSITSFFVDSMQQHPALDRCGTDRCSSEQKAARLSLMLKSFQGYIEVLSQSNEAVAISAALPIIAKIKEGGIETLLETDPEAAQAALLNILEQDELLKLVNPELVALVQSSPNPEFHVRDIVAATKAFGQFNASDPTILVRPGLLNFEELATRLGVAASFYAGYAPANPDDFGKFLDACAEQSKGKAWSEVRGLSAGEATCGAMFYAQMGGFHAEFDGAKHANRVNDMVGATMPALISTSVLSGDAIQVWEKAQQDYQSGTVEFSWDVNFNDVRFGYWGPREAMDVIETKTNDRADLKSMMAVGLGEASWKTVLSMSPAEPGLARALPIDSTRVSAGGWSDLHPVLVLKDIGCDKVVYVTRTDAESGFATGVAGLLGMTPTDASDLYDLNNSESSFAQSLQEADAVVCTNWNQIEATQIDALVKDAYNAPIQTRDVFFKGKGHSNVVEDTGKLGCTVPR